MNFINPITFIVIATFLMGFIFLDKKNVISKLLLFILISSTAIEILSIFLLIQNENLNLLYTIGFVFHNFLWISILFTVFDNYRLKKTIPLLYLTFAVINFISIEKNELNNMSFVVGSILYLLSLLIGIFKTLKIENLDFFFTNKFLLLLSPVIFFFGFSFIFSFKIDEIRFLKIFKNIDLYTLISYSINVAYYSLINLYIYKERKQQKLNG